MNHFNTLINLIQNPDKSVTLTFPDEDKLVRSVTGPPVCYKGLYVESNVPT